MRLHLAVAEDGDEEPEAHEAGEEIADEANDGDIAPHGRDYGVDDEG